jgi:hypothetical protein
VDNIEELKQWSGNEDDGEKRHDVATFNETCTAYVRTILRRALELNNLQHVWTGTEFINAAVRMTRSPSVLPDVPVWRLTEMEVKTIHRALEWHASKRRGGFVDTGLPTSILLMYARIELEVERVMRGIWHSQGKYWM